MNCRVFCIHFSDVDGALVLHQSGEYYSYGLLSEQTQLFVISVTLDNPSGLPEVN